MTINECPKSLLPDCQRLNVRPEIASGPAAPRLACDATRLATTSSAIRIQDRLAWLAIVRTPQEHRPKHIWIKGLANVAELWGGSAAFQRSASKLGLPRGNLFLR